MARRIIRGCWLGIAAALLWPAQAPATQLDGAELLQDLGCGACHTGVPAADGRLAERAPALGSGAAAYPPDFLYSYLGEPRPVREHIGASRMPDFGLDPRERLALTLLLAQPGQPAAPDGAFARAKTDHPGVSAADGRQIFDALNCAGCHAHGEFRPRRSAPDLSWAVARLRPGWLRRYLSSPHAIRPAGMRPGDGARMPDFRLTEAEAETLTVHLQGPVAPADQVGEPAALSAFRRKRVQLMLSRRWACLGCHRRAGVGGRIGPDLSAVGERLRPAAIRAIIDDPLAAGVGPHMPDLPLDQRQIDDLTALLATPGGHRTVEPYLPLLDLPLGPAEADPNDYRDHCASCHGSAGNGDGFNAAFLAVPATRHADPAYMSTRPDDTLFDGIYAGGLMLGRSAAMPAWGGSLSAQRIAALVDHMRVLCDCRQPAWAEDDAP